MLENFDLRLLNVGYDAAGERWNWKNVCSPFARIYLVENGKGVVEFEDSSLLLSPGYLYLIPPFVRHSCRGEAGFCHYYLHLYEWPGAGPGMFDEFSFAESADAAEAHRSIFRMLTDLLPDSRLVVSDPDVYDNDKGLRDYCAAYDHLDAAARVLARGAMLVLLSRLVLGSRRASRRFDSRLQKAWDFINENIGSELTTAALAEVACMSESHFIRAFRKEFGRTPAQYIIRRRVETAQRLLLLSKQPLKEVALNLGFTDLPHFVKTFKRFTGMTPNSYRLSDAF